MIKKEGQIRKGLITIVLLVGLFLLSIPSSTLAFDITKENILFLTNQTRQDQGVSLLEENSRLNQAAQNKAKDMISRGYWAHFYQGERPWDWMEQAGYKYIEAGENLAIDFVKAEDINQAWLESSSHRDNLLNPKYQDIGIGISEGWFKDHNTIIVVQMFGRTKASNKVQGIDDQPRLQEPDELETRSLVQEPSSLLTRILSWIGEKSLITWQSIKSASQNSLAWLGSKILPGYSVFAD